MLKVYSLPLMTGKIKSFSNESTSGLITAEDGLSLFFRSSEVLAYDTTCLAVGQLVTFDVEGGSCPRAVNVCVRRQHQVPPAPEKRPGSTQFRYLGFDQAGSIRSYRFDGRSADDQTNTFVVLVDLALFTKHHVGIQEGPALCLRLLSAETGGAGKTIPRAFECRLTDKDMLAHLASRPVPGARRGPKRTPHTPSAAAHHA